MASRPTDATFAAIVTAIAAIEADPHAPRTKAHLMRLAGIAHPTVHRAFKWDSDHGTPFRINERWNALTGDTPTRRSPAQNEQAQLESKLKEKQRELAALRDQLDSARLVAAAAWLRSAAGGYQPTPVTRARKDKSAS